MANAFVASALLFIVLVDIAILLLDICILFDVADGDPDAAASESPPFARAVVTSLPSPPPTPPPPSYSEALLLTRLSRSPSPG